MKCLLAPPRILKREKQHYPEHQARRVCSKKEFKLHDLFVGDILQQHIPTLYIISSWCSRSNASLLLLELTKSLEVSKADLDKWLQTISNHNIMETANIKKSIVSQINVEFFVWLSATQVLISPLHSSHLASTVDSIWVDWDRSCFLAGRCLHVQIDPAKWPDGYRICLFCSHCAQEQRRTKRGSIKWDKKRDKYREGNHIVS